MAQLENIDINRAAEILGYSVRTIRELVKTNRLKCYRKEPRGKMHFKTRELLISRDHGYQNISILEKKRLI